MTHENEKVYLEPRRWLTQCQIDELIAAAEQRGREQAVNECRAAAKHFMEASGNMTEVQKVDAHDTCLVLAGMIRYGLFRTPDTSE